METSVEALPTRSEYCLKTSKSKLFSNTTNQLNVSDHQDEQQQQLLQTESGDLLTNNDSLLQGEV